MHLTNVFATVKVSCAAAAAAVYAAVVYVRLTLK